MSACSPRPRWPKVFSVSVLSNAAILALFYSPHIYEYGYYLLDLVKVVPLVLLLVYVARKDPAPNWTYRAMCWVFILQIATGGWHILAGLNSPYYDQLSMSTTAIELMIIVIGGFNVRLSIVGKRAGSNCSSPSCSLWVKRNSASRG